MRDGLRVVGSRVLLALVLSVTAVPVCTSDEGAGCDWQPGTHHVEVDGVQRRYEVAVEDPDGPVVLALHGAVGNPEAFEARTGMAAADRGVVITPASDGVWWRHRDAAERRCRLPQRPPLRRRRPCGRLLERGHDGPAPGLRRADRLGGGRRGHGRGGAL